MNKNSERQNILNHRLSLINVVNDHLMDNLSRYQRASEISKQTLKLCYDNSEDNSLDNLLILLSEVVPSESQNMLELIKGALYQSQLLKTITVPRIQTKILIEDEQEGDDMQFRLKREHIAEQQQSEQNLNNDNNEVENYIPSHNKLYDIQNSLNQSNPNMKQKKDQEKGKKPLEEQNVNARKKVPMIDNMVVQDNAENDLKFQVYIKGINKLEEDHNLKITEIFKDKNLYLKRQQNASLPICTLLDKKDKMLIIKLDQQINNQDILAAYLNIQRRLIQKLVRLNRDKKL